MALPATWPPRPATGVRSIRFYKTGTGTANFADNAFIFADLAGANTFLPTPYVAPGGESTTVNIGTTSSSGSPMGGGRNAHDAVNDPKIGTAVPPPPPAMIWAHSMRITAVTANVEFSFDGTNVHGIVLAGQTGEYFNRHEAGIAVRGTGATFYIEAW
jgi:hypothetical protein